MTYTVWMHGQQIGETNFELSRTRRRQAGAFQPTEFGLQVLPSITAMMPALFDFGDLCRRTGLDPDDPAMDGAAAMATFTETDEGRRIMTAAKQIEQVEVRDPVGRLVGWESLAITDFEWLVRQAGKRLPHETEEPPEITSKPHDPIRFMISLTVKKRGPERTNAEMQ